MPAAIIPVLSMVASAVMSNAQQKHTLRDNENQQTAANQAASANDVQAHNRLDAFNKANPSPGFGNTVTPPTPQKAATPGQNNAPKQNPMSTFASDPNSPTMQILKAAQSGQGSSTGAPPTTMSGAPSALSPQVLAMLQGHGGGSTT